MEESPAMSPIDSEDDEEGSSVYDSEDGLHYQEAQDGDADDDTTNLKIKVPPMRTKTFWNDKTTKTSPMMRILP